MSEPYDTLAAMRDQLADALPRRLVTLEVLDIGAPGRTLEEWQRGVFTLVAQERTGYVNFWPQGVNRAEQLQVQVLAQIALDEGATSEDMLRAESDLIADLEGSIGSAWQPDRVVELKRTKLDGGLFAPWGQVLFDLEVQ